MFYICLTSKPADRSCYHFDHQYDDDYVNEGFTDKEMAEQMLKYYIEEYDVTGYVWERKES